MQLEEAMTAALIMTSLPGPMSMQDDMYEPAPIQVMLNVRIDPQIGQDLKRRTVDEDLPIRDIIVYDLTPYIAGPSSTLVGLKTTVFD